MKLSPAVAKRYTKEQLSAVEAQRLAEYITWGPVIFEVARLLRKFRILEYLNESKDGLTVTELVEKTACSEYAINVLVEGGLSAGILLVEPESERYRLSKTGWFLLTEESKAVNLDFVHDVNYRGLYYLEEALTEGRPAGLETLGDWKTIYEGLSHLTPRVQESWLAFDHYYSDNSFDKALPIVFAQHPKRLLDIGGNTGKFALRCVEYDPEIRVTIADLLGQLRMMKEFVAGKVGAERIEGYAIDQLDAQATLPREAWDVIWMSQFLVCFSEDEIYTILSRAAAVMSSQTRLFIMDLFWNLQRSETAALCLTMTSVYFTALANGNSKFYRSDVFEKQIERAGLKVIKLHDQFGLGHNILEVVKA